MHRTATYRTILCFFSLTLCLSVIGCRAAPDYPERSVIIRERSTSSPTNDQAKATTKQQGLLINAKVGDVNGRPIYATEIFKKIGEQQLRQLGQHYSRLDFQRWLTESLAAYLRGQIESDLILAEAENTLTPPQQQGLQLMIKKHRETLLAPFQHNEAALIKSLRETKNRTIAEELESFRQQVLTQKYMREKLFPYIQVAHHEIEHYYKTHQKEFNPAASVDLRLLIVSTDTAAQAVEKALTAGQSFDSVAADFTIVYKDQKGQTRIPLTTDLKTFDELAWPQVNQAVRGLAVGAHSKRLTLQKGHFAWVKLEKHTQAQTIPLNQVFLNIKNELSRQKYAAQSRKYMDALIKRGNFTPINHMLQDLVHIAMIRYARPTSASPTNQAPTPPPPSAP